MAQDNRTTFEKMKEDLKRVADEVKLKVHLAGMEAKEQWEKLEPKLQKFEQQAADASVATGDAITDGVNKLGAELKEQLEKLREKVNKKD